MHFVTTRTVRDTAAALDVLAGPMVGDPFEIAPPEGTFLSQVGAPVEPLRIAYWDEPWSGHDADPEVAAATGATARLLADLGHEVEQARPAFDWEAFLTAMTDVWSSTTAHTIDAMAAALGRRVDGSTLEGPTLALVEHGRAVTAQRVLDAMVTVNTITRSMGSFFSWYDVLLTPTLGARPAKLGVYDPHADTSPKETFAENGRILESFLPVFNATGQPAISLPLHQSATGLPIGMQLVGRRKARPGSCGWRPPSKWPFRGRGGFRPYTLAAVRTVADRSRHVQEE